MRRGLHGKGIKKKEGQEAERIKGTKWPVFSVTRSLCLVPAPAQLVLYLHFSCLPAALLHGKTLQNERQEIPHG